MVPNPDKKEAPPKTMTDMFKLVGEEEIRQFIPPPNSAEFPEKAQFAMEGEDTSLQQRPPPVEPAEFPVKRQSEMLTADSQQ